jgi:hypothetical protein
MREETKTNVTDDRLVKNLNGYADDPKLTSLKVKREATNNWTIVARFRD